RVVHQGLRGVLNDSFDISPIAAEAEGQTVVLPDDFDSSRFRILRQKPGSEKPAGILLHRGWEALSIRLPRISHRPGEALPRVFAPAEIEAREGV
ncbi:MAG: DUF2760 domain-containing protein, partial [Proteobacteria bacterium]|nr:DUF2760 domain-containing protein [Pseudomonadota bacterium]